MYYLGENINSESFFFKKLFESYFSTLCLFAQSILDDSDESKDVVQEVFLKLFNSKAIFDNEKAIKAYLYTSTRNGCLDALKANSKSFDLEDYQMSSYTENQFLIDVVKEETFRLLHIAIDQLSPQSQKTVELTMRSLSNKEIAHELGISINTVKTLKLRAYKKLRKILSPQFMGIILSFFILDQ